jgi:MFS family permease
MFTHHFHWDPRLNGLSLLLTSQAVRAAALILLWLFSPFYVLKVLKSLPAVFFYFLIIFTTKFLFLHLAEKTGVKYGFKNVIFLSTIPFLLYIPILIFAKEFPILVFAAGIFWGVHLAFFWWGYNGFFVETAQENQYGRAMGIANILGTIVLVVSPLLGAFVVESFGFQALFWFSALVFSCSMLLLLPMQNHKPHLSVGQEEIIQLLLKHKRRAVAYLGYSAESTYLATAWPLFLFLVLENPAEVGGVASSAAFLAAILTFGIGFWLDKRGLRARQELIGLGSPLTSLTWFIRGFAKSAPVFVFVDAMYRFVEPLMYMPLEVWAYKKAKEGSVDRAMLFRQYAITSGEIFSTFLALILLVFWQNLSIAFVLAGIFALLPLLVLKNKENGQS